MKNVFNKQYILLVISMLITTTLFSQEIVKKGKVDISNFDLNKNRISLHGQWEFYPNQLYLPESFIKEKAPNPVYINVPELWNKSKQKEISTGKGYGTYRLILNNLKKGKIYALNINRIQSAYQIWINGKSLKSIGKVGINKNESKPGWSSSDIIFKADNITAEIIIQVSNFHHKKGGIEKNITFGDNEKIIDAGWRVLILNIFLLGALMIMASYHLGMFVFRSNDKSNLYFALTLIFTGIFSSTESEILLIKIIPDLNWQVLLKTLYISNYLRLLFFLLFIYYSFKKQLNRIFTNILTIIIIVLILFVAVTPASIFTNTLFIFLILAGITLIYLVFGQIKALLNKIPGSLYSLIGISILIFAAANDILQELHLIKTISLTTFGFFMFIILHSYLISVQNAYSYKSIKKTTENLKLQGIVKDALFSANSYNLREPLKAISEVIDSDRALIFIYRDNNWVATNEYIKKEKKITKMRVNVFSGKEDIYFSARSVKKAISSRKRIYTIVTDAVKAKEHAYLENSEIKALFTYPLIKDDLIQGLLYFENYSIKPNFENITVGILQAIMPQIAVFMDNFTSYYKLNAFNEELEEKVLQATKEIEARNKELKDLRTEVEKQNLSIGKTKVELEKQNQQISDGTYYAKKIQNAFLPFESEIKSVFPENFIILKPKDVLSGDFYWFEKISPTESILVVADSTGISVSGALMTIIGHEIINETVIYKKNKSPKIILNKIQNEFEKKISKENYLVGYDLSIINFNIDKREVIFSGAQHPAFFIRDNNMIEFKATSVSIGHSELLENYKKTRFFTNSRISLKKGDMLYLFSDGFIKQVGEKSQKKYMKLNFKTLIKSIHNDKPELQKEKLEIALSEWKGNEQQTDDILIVGIKF
ncbi:MAG: SpoIIE family protein phosphatase [Bacteroidales bacterium]|nr:SpoIIE family protein phosphatase [Bacteroidales bacterium]